MQLSEWEKHLKERFDRIELIGELDITESDVAELAPQIRQRIEIEKLQVELLASDEKLRHYADRGITLDLDDGVKVNYGKFGDLLDEVSAVHGKKAEGA